MEEIYKGKTKLERFYDYMIDTLEAVTKDGFILEIVGKKKRFCPRCNKDISNRAKSAIYCVGCSKG